MNERTPYMWVFILILVALMAGWVHIARLNTRRPPTVPFRKTISRQPTQPDTLQEDPSRIDFTDILDEQAVPSAALPAQKQPQPHIGFSEQQKLPTQPRQSSHRVYPPANEQPAGQAVSSHAPRAAAAQPSQPAQQARTIYIPSGNHSNAPSAAAKTVPSPTKTQATTYTQQGASGTVKAKSLRGQNEPSMSSQTTRNSDLFDGYFPRQTLEEQRELNRKVDQFSDALDAAILKAFPRKSKREQNIEKYMQHQEGTAAASSADEAKAAAAENIKQQFAAQTKSIVRDMATHYGGAAAGKAASIMKDFEQEMTQLLDSDMDPMEKQVAAQRINTKYNKKLQQLNKAASKAKIKEQLRAENEQYLKKVSDVYGAEVANALRPVTEEYMNKRAALYATATSEEEAIEQQAALEADFRAKQEKILNKYAPGATGSLTGLKNDEIEQRVKEQAEAERAGKGISATYTAPKSGSVQKEWNGYAQTFVKTLEKQSAPADVVAYAKERYQQLAAEMAQLNEQARQAEQPWTVARWNEESLKLQKAAEKDYLNYIDEKAEKEYNDFYEENYKNLPGEIKGKARAIWEKYNHALVQLGRVSMSPEDAAKQKKEIESQRDKQLQELFQQVQ